VDIKRQHDVVILSGVMLIRAELTSGAAGTLWFAWQYARLMRRTACRDADKADAIREAESILGIRRRRGVMFVHNGLSARRPYQR
jgi:hypothetical protein